MDTRIIAGPPFPELTNGALRMSGCSQEAAWLEQQEALLAMQAALPVQQPGYISRAAKKTRAPELDDAESQQYSPYPRFSRCASGCILDAPCTSPLLWLNIWWS